MTISEAIRPSGRFSRLDFAIWGLGIPIALYIGSIVLIAICVAISGAESILTDLATLSVGPAVLVMIYLVIVSLIKRLRDIGRGWFLVIAAFVPFLNLLFLLWLLITPGKADI